MTQYLRPRRSRGGEQPQKVWGARWVDLGNGVFSLVDASHYSLVSDHTWHPTPDGYASTKVGKQTVLMHRLIMEVTDSKKVVDHKSWNRLDNRKSNLRITNRSMNLANGAKFRGESKYRGVSRNKKRWAASVNAHGIKHYQGTFDTPEQAARAYDDGARTLHGEFARLNFPRQDEQAC